MSDEELLSDERLVWIPAFDGTEHFVRWYPALRAKMADRAQGDGPAPYFQAELPPDAKMADGWQELASGYLAG